MIPIVAVNYLAILLAAVATFILGMLWYGFIFKKLWMQLMGWDQKKLKEMKKTMTKNVMVKTHIIGFIMSLIMAYVLAHIIGFSQATTFADALMVGFWTWLGFIATIMLGSVLWEGKPVKLYAINVLYYLVSILLMATIITLWV